MFSKLTIRDYDVSNKKVLVRVDYNVPLTEDGQVADDTRILATLPTLRYLINKGAKVILVTHLGRPKGYDPRLRVDPLAEALARYLGRPVRKIDRTVGEEVKAFVEIMKPGDVVFLENIRFHKEEKENDLEFAKELASLADVYVNDAFGTSHRKHASVVGVPNFLPALAGFLLEREVIHLSKLLERPNRPFHAILGGNKISDKLGVIQKFLQIVDCLYIGGGMCFTFLKAMGYNVGQSIVWEDYLEEAKRILEEVKNGNANCRFFLPEDVVLAPEIKASAPVKITSVENFYDDWRGLDIGPRTIETFSKKLLEAKTIFWNGPMGVYEIEKFSKGTKAICEALAYSEGTTIVGGGDSDAALREFGYSGLMSFVSTGGGASLKFLEGESLPGVDVLMDRY
ncbi:MAG: phosphoglycerate kinase [Actinobacteria bacterium]|nr:phosphoglycerate kinase [Actinomycetota bacterium]